jgi:hypothetical protein
METVPEPVPDRTTINGRGAGPHADADADAQTRAHGGGSGLTSSTRGPRQETHNEDDNPGYPTGGIGGAEEGYAEVEATAWTTCVFLFLNLCLSWIFLVGRGVVRIIWVSCSVRICIRTKLHNQITACAY